MNTNKQLLRIAHVGSLGTYHHLSAISEIQMCIGTLATNDSDYAEYFRVLSKHQYTILDSGVLEASIGTHSMLVQDDDFLELALELGVKELVTPDSPNDPKQSLKKSIEFLKKYYTTLTTAGTQIMVVPHGDTVAQWLENAQILLRKAPGCTLGIPRLLAQKCGNGDGTFRLRIAKQIVKLFPHVKIHLLGASETLADELLLSTQYPYIRSIDTTFIYRTAINGNTTMKEYAAPKTLLERACPKNFAYCATSLAQAVTTYKTGLLDRE